MSFPCGESQRTCQAWISALFGAGIFFMCIIVTFIALAIYSYTCGRKERDSEENESASPSKISSKTEDEVLANGDSLSLNNSSFITTVSSKVKTNHDFQSFGCYLDSIVRRDKSATFSSWKNLDSTVDEFGSDEIVIIDQNYWRTYPNGSNHRNRLVFVTAKEAKSIPQLEDYLSSEPNTDSELQVSHETPQNKYTKPPRPAPRKIRENSETHVDLIKSKEDKSNHPATHPEQKAQNIWNKGSSLKQKRMTQSFSYETTRTITIRKNISFKGDSSLVNRKYKKYKKDSTKNKVNGDQRFSNPIVNMDSSISSPSSEDRQIASLASPTDGISHVSKRNEVLKKPTSGRKYHRPKQGNMFPLTSPEVDDLGELQKRMESPLSTGSSFQDDAIDSLVYKELIEASKESEQRVKRRNRPGAKDHKRKKVLIDPYPMRLDISDSGDM